MLQLIVLLATIVSALFVLRLFLLGVRRKGRRKRLTKRMENIRVRAY